MTVSLGQVLSGRYRVVRALGSGGFGRSFAAEDLSRGGLVAIKELDLGTAEDWRAVERFERESKVLASLSHPGIPRWLESFQAEDGASFFLVQELVEGESLAAFVAGGGRLGEAEVRQVAEEVLEILAYLHELSPPVFHRDVKPANLIRRPGGSIALVDFGSVRDGASGTSHSVAGTFGYMAPEQLAGKAGPGTDLYGLGATLLHLLTHKDPSELPQRRLRLDFRGLVSLPESFLVWLELMVEPAPEDRHASARAALAALRSGARRASVALVQRPPHGSRIVAGREGSRLDVVIPGAGLGAQPAFTFLFSMFWLSFVAVWTLGAAQASYLFAAFSIPFWAVGVFLLSTSLFTAFGRTKLTIDPERFEIERSLAGFGFSKEGATRNLDAVREQSVGVRGKQPLQGSRTVVLREGVTEHSFGGHLSDAEREWLVQMLEEYVALRRASRG